MCSLRNSKPLPPSDWTPNSLPSCCPVGVHILFPLQNGLTLRCLWAYGLEPLLKGVVFGRFLSSRCLVLQHWSLFQMVLALSWRHLPFGPLCVFLAVRFCGRCWWLSSATRHTLCLILNEIARQVIAMRWSHCGVDQANTKCLMNQKTAHEGRCLISFGSLHNTSWFDEHIAQSLAKKPPHRGSLLLIAMNQTPLKVKITVEPWIAWLLAEAALILLLLLMSVQCNTPHLVLNPEWDC